MVEKTPFWGQLDIGSNSSSATVFFCDLPHADSETRGWMQGVDLGENPRNTSWGREVREGKRSRAGSLWEPSHRVAPRQRRRVQGARPPMSSHLTHCCIFSLPVSFSPAPRPDKLPAPRPSPQGSAFGRAHTKLSLGAFMMVTR